VREHEIYSVGYSSAETPLKSPAERARRNTGEAFSRNAAGNASTARLIFHVEKWLGYRPLAYGTAAFSALAFLLALLTSVIGEEPQASPARRTHATNGNVKAPKSPVTATRNVATAEPRLHSTESAKDKPTGDEKRPPVARDAQAPADAEPASTAEPAARPKRHFLRIPFFGSGHDSEPEQETANAESTQQTRAPATAVTETESSSTSSTAAEHVGDEDPATDLANADGATGEYATRVQQSAGASAHASVALAISPWGEVFVDGKSIGVSPPLNEIELLPGSRVIEIRNGDFPPFTQRVELKAQQRIKIRYKFN
jgi:hypothetical protein